VAARARARDGRGDRLCGAAEHHEERITLSIDLVPFVCGKRGPQQSAVLGQYGWISVAEPHGQQSARLDVSEENREGSVG
jgi:hypothetical protein